MPPPKTQRPTTTSAFRKKAFLAAILGLTIVLLVWVTVGDEVPFNPIPSPGEEPLEELEPLAPLETTRPEVMGEEGGHNNLEIETTSVAVVNGEGSEDASIVVIPTPKPSSVFPDFGLDKSVTELIVEDPARDGTLFNVRTSRWCDENPGMCDSTTGLPPAVVEDSGDGGGEGGWEGSNRARAAVEGKPFLTKNEWKGKCWYETEMFCVLNGTLTFFHDHRSNPSPAGHSLRMCNEFSQRSQLIRLKYQSLPMPSILPAPLYTKTPGWVLQFWCQDLFHMTLSMLPAFHTKQYFHNAALADASFISNNASGETITGIGGESMPAVKGRHVSPDIHIRIAKGKRKKGSFCRVKLGDPREWEDVRNKKWSDAQFPIAGNPYWPFYQVLTDKPDRLYPMYKGATQKSTCYSSGIIDKKYIKESTGLQARQYSSELLKALKVPTGGAKRVCGKYRVTLIDRRGRTRKLTNIAEIAALGREKGFTVTPVALELLPIRKQLELITSTDVLMGMHGNGITWLQFLPPGSAVLELVGVWYTPYSLLWGHKHFHSSMKNNKPFKEGGEYKPFAHNMTEIAELLDKVKAHLDSTSCEKEPFTPPNERLDNLYKSCVPHC